MPALTPEYNHSRGDLVGSILYRFQLYLSELHDATRRRAIALQIMSHPELSTLNSRIRAYVLCRSAANDLGAACADVEVFAENALRSFPQEGVFNYGSPRWLTVADTKNALFHGEDPASIDLIEIRKFEEIQEWSQQPSLRYVPHRFWADQQRDPWQALIETLAAMRQKAAVRIELTPARLARDEGLDFVSLAGRWFEVIDEDLERKASQGEQVRTDGVVTEEMLRRTEVQRASANRATISFVRRGRHVYQQLVTFADHVFCMRVILAAQGRVPESVIGSVSAALSTPPASGDHAAIGWGRPSAVRPKPGEAPEALNSLRFMVQNRWGRSPPSPATANKVDLRSVVTPEEAVALFHLPIYDRAGQTSALSTAEAPFVIPPETLARKPGADAAPPGAKKKNRKISMGYLYQRETLLDGRSEEAGAQEFEVSINDLMKPSLLVGAPGSGKTNLALSLLVQLWRDHAIPFLVLDPSTGQEFRLLQADPALKDDLVVYSVGDVNGLSLQFNPLSVPPDVTVRNHTTRILAAFRAAFSMFDPVPAIYEGALERIYTDPRYIDDGRIIGMEDKGALDSPAPTLSKFAAAIQDEVQEKAISLYQGSAETIGIIRGASTIRVNAIGKKLGHIINVAGNSGDFLAKMLRRPVVIELGALGDSSNIALVMAFLLTQLAGQVEDAFRKDKTRRHLIFIEEAHRLLARGDGEGVAGKSAEDLNMMLAEVRKFGQGILVMDQRPSSLVGGVLDNAYVKILSRLSDRVGFDRLSDELNLSEAQQRFARTRLKVGDAILLDRDAGQPVLTRSADIKTRLEQDWPGDEAFKRRNAANAERSSLTPPPSFRYVEPSLGAAEAPAAAAASKVGGARGWVAREIGDQAGALLETLRQNSALYHGLRDKLAGGAAEVGAAKASLDSEIENSRAEFDRFVGRIWEKLEWGLIGVVAEDGASAAVKAKIEELRDAASSNPIDPPAGRVGVATNGAAPVTANAIRAG